MWKTLLLVLSIFTCLGGANVSDMLLTKSINPAALPPIFDEVCSESVPETQPGKATLSGCDVVAESEYSSFMGMPNGYWGIVYFMGMGLWLLVVGVPSYEKRIIHIGLMCVSIMSVLGSLTYIYLMKFVIEATCPWCMLSHACNFLLCILVILLYWQCGKSEHGFIPSHPDDENEKTTGDTAQETVQPAPIKEPVGLISGYFDNPASHPVTRLQFGMALLILFMCGMYWQSAVLKRAKANLAQAQETIDTLPEKAQAALQKQIEAFEEDVYRLYQRSPKQNLKVRPDDPVRITGEHDKKVSVVIFSDLECPSCRRFAHTLENDLIPLFDNNFKVYFKHFPLNKKCNSKMPRDMHPNACKLAYAAEAARIQGGSEAFWNAHDLLFEKSKDRKALKTLDYGKVAEELGLDPEKFLADMESPAVHNRIQEDIKLARDLGVRATPTVFLARKQVPQFARTHKKFWQRLANIYKDRYMKESKPEKQASKPGANNTAKPAPSEPVTQEKKKQQ